MESEWKEQLRDPAAAADGQKQQHTRKRTHHLLLPAITVSSSASNTSPDTQRKQHHKEHKHDTEPIPSTLPVPPTLPLFSVTHRVSAGGQVVSLSPVDLANLIQSQPSAASIKQNKLIMPSTETLINIDKHPKAQNNFVLLDPLPPTPSPPPAAQRIIVAEEEEKEQHKQEEDLRQKRREQRQKRRAERLKQIQQRLEAEQELLLLQQRQEKNQEEKIQPETEEQPPADVSNTITSGQNMLNLSPRSRASRLYQAHLQKRPKSSFPPGVADERLIEAVRNSMVTIDGRESISNLSAKIQSELDDAVIHQQQELQWQTQAESILVEVDKESATERQTQHVHQPPESMRVSSPANEERDAYVLERIAVPAHRAISPLRVTRGDSVVRPSTSVADAVCTVSSRPLTPVTISHSRASPQQARLPSAHSRQRPSRNNSQREHHQAPSTQRPLSPPLLSLKKQLDEILLRAEPEAASVSGFIPPPVQPKLMTGQHMSSMVLHKLEMESIQAKIREAHNRERQLKALVSEEPDDPDETQSQTNVNQADNEHYGEEDAEHDSSSSSSSDDDDYGPHKNVEARIQRAMRKQQRQRYRVSRAKTIKPLALPILAGERSTTQATDNKQSARDSARAAHSPPSPAPVQSSVELPTMPVRSSIRLRGLTGLRKLRAAVRIMAPLANSKKKLMEATDSPRNTATTTAVSTARDGPASNTQQKKYDTTHLLLDHKPILIKETGDRLDKETILQHYLPNLLHIMSLLHTAQSYSGLHYAEAPEILSMVGDMPTDCTSHLQGKDMMILDRWLRCVAKRYIQQVLNRDSPENSTDADTTQNPAEGFSPYLSTRSLTKTSTETLGLDRRTLYLMGFTHPTIDRIYSSLFAHGLGLASLFHQLLFYRVKHPVDFLHKTWLSYLRLLEVHSVDLYAYSRLLIKQSNQRRAAQIWQLHLQAVAHIKDSIQSIRQEATALKQRIQQAQDDHEDLLDEISSLRVKLMQLRELNWQQGQHPAVEYTDAEIEVVQARALSAEKELQLTYQSHTTVRTEYHQLVEEINGYRQSLQLAEFHNKDMQQTYEQRAEMIQVLSSEIPVLEAEVVNLEEQAIEIAKQADALTRASHQAYADYVELLKLIEFQQQAILQIKVDGLQSTLAESKDSLLISIGQDAKRAKEAAKAYWTALYTDEVYVGKLDLDAFTAQVSELITSLSSRVLSPEEKEKMGIAEYETQMQERMTEAHTVIEQKLQEQAEIQQSIDELHVQLQQQQDEYRVVYNQDQLYTTGNENLRAEINTLSSQLAALYPRQQQTQDAIAKAQDEIRNMHQRIESVPSLLLQLQQQIEACMPRQMELSSIERTKGEIVQELQREQVKVDQHYQSICQDGMDLQEELQELQFQWNKQEEAIAPLYRDLDSKFSLLCRELEYKQMEYDMGEKKRAELQETTFLRTQNHREYLVELAVIQQQAQQVEENIAAVTAVWLAEQEEQEGIRKSMRDIREQMEAMAVMKTEVIAAYVLHQQQAADKKAAAQARVVQLQELLEHTKAELKASLSMNEQMMIGFDKRVQQWKAQYATRQQQHEKKLQQHAERRVSYEKKTQSYREQQAVQQAILQQQQQEQQRIQQEIAEMEQKLQTARQESVRLQEEYTQASHYHEELTSAQPIVQQQLEVVLEREAEYDEQEIEHQITLQLSKQRELMFRITVLEEEQWARTLNRTERWLQTDETLQFHALNPHIQQPYQLGQELGLMPLQPRDRSSTGTTTSTTHRLSSSSPSRSLNVDVNAVHHVSPIAPFLSPGRHRSLVNEASIREFHHFLANQAAAVKQLLKDDQQQQQAEQQLEAQLQSVEIQPSISVLHKRNKTRHGRTGSQWWMQSMEMDEQQAASFMQEVHDQQPEEGRSRENTQPTGDTRADSQSHSSIDRHPRSSLSIPAFGGHPALSARRGSVIAGQSRRGSVMIPEEHSESPLLRPYPVAVELNADEKAEELLPGATIMLRSASSDSSHSEFAEENSHRENIFSASSSAANSSAANDESYRDARQFSNASQSDGNRSTDTQRSTTASSFNMQADGSPTLSWSSASFTNLVEDFIQQNQVFVQTEHLIHSALTSQRSSSSATSSHHSLGSRPTSATAAYLRVSPRLTTAHSLNIPQSRPASAGVNTGRSGNTSLRPRAQTAHTPQAPTSSARRVSVFEDKSDFHSGFEAVEAAHIDNAAEKLQSQPPEQQATAVAVHEYPGFETIPSAIVVVDQAALEHPQKKSKKRKTARPKPADRASVDAAGNPVSTQSYKEGMNAWIERQILQRIQQQEQETEVKQAKQQARTQPQLPTTAMKGDQADKKVASAQQPQQQQQLGMAPLHQEQQAKQQKVDVITSATSGLPILNASTGTSLPLPPSVVLQPELASYDPRDPGPTAGYNADITSVQHHHLQHRSSASFIQVIDKLTPIVPPLVPVAPSAGKHLALLLPDQQEMKVREKQQQFEIEQPLEKETSEENKATPPVSVQPAQKLEAHNPTPAEVAGAPARPPSKPALPPSKHLDLKRVSPELDDYHRLFPPALTPASVSVDAGSAWHLPSNLMSPTRKVQRKLVYVDDDTKPGRVPNFIKRSLMKRFAEREKTKEAQSGS